jgi:hypothetical protein
VGAGPAASTSLGEVVAGLAALDVDGLDDERLRVELGGVQQAIRQLTGLRARWQGTLEDRELRRAGPGRERQALRRVRDRTAEDLRLTPSEVKRDGETGRRIGVHAQAAAALAAGELSTDHARVLADTMRWIEGEDARREVEAYLLGAAKDQDAVTFGRTARRLLAEREPRSAQDAEDRRHQRRYLRIAQTPDGMTALHGQLAGIDAELLHTALHAFQGPDAPGQQRSPEQRCADALVQVCDVALRAGEAPEQHGVRPHLLVTVDEPTVADRDGTGGGVCEGAWTGPMPWTEARRLLADAGVSRVLLDPAQAPTRAGAEVRTVPAGLWRALNVRHRTCAGDGCSVPVGWCQVMHLDTPYRLQGRLDLDTAAPGCTFHHRMFDRRGWTVTWCDGVPVVHHPGRPPDRPPDRSPDRSPGRPHGRLPDRPPSSPPG